MEILIVGDSHVEAMNVTRSFDGSTTIAPIASHGDGVLGVLSPWPRPLEAFWAAALEGAKDRAVAVSYGGNIHLARFLFAPQPMFDFVASEHPDLPLDESVELIPEAAIRAELAPHVINVRPRLEALAKVAAKVLYIGSPPPKGDDEFIAKCLRAEKFFVNLAKSSNIALEDVRFSPRLLRLKLWHALQAIMRETAEGVGATFVPAPEAGKTDEGYLHADYYAVDVSHANKLYGAQVVANLRRYVD